MTVKTQLKDLYIKGYALRMSLIKGLQLSDGVVFKGMPLIGIARGASIRIERGVTINSRNGGYHVNMHSPVKLLADRPGAIIHIGEDTRIHGSCIHAYCSISIGKRCLIAANCQIIDCNGHELSFDDRVARRADWTGQRRCCGQRSGTRRAADGGGERQSCPDREDGCECWRYGLSRASASGLVQVLRLSLRPCVEASGTWRW
jgi:hypothetical protein